MVQQLRKLALEPKVSIARRLRKYCMGTDFGAALA